MDDLFAELERAKDDLNAWRAAFVAERAMRYREGGMKIEQARIHAETDAARMAVAAAAQQHAPPSSREAATMADVELLPLPEHFAHQSERVQEHVRAYARANLAPIQADFEAWAASIGFCVTGKYAETIDVLCAKSAFKAGYQAGRAALAQQPEAQCGEELPSPLNGDFDCPKAAAARSCPCGFCRAMRTPSAPVVQPDWGVAPPGATHYQPRQDAYYKRVSASEWYVWSRVGTNELLRWLPSPGTSDSAEWVVRPAEAQAGGEVA